MHYEKECFLAAGTYKLKVAFTSGGHAFGKLEAPLTIDAYDGKQFMLSVLALSKEVHPASDLGSVEKTAELLEGHTPLIYKDKKIVPTGGDTFAKTDPVVVYGEIYEPLIATPTPPTIELRVQVVDKKTEGSNEWAITRPGSHTNSGHYYATLPLVKLKSRHLYLPASTRCRSTFEAADSAGKIMLRSADFEIK